MQCRSEQMGPIDSSLLILSLEDLFPLVRMLSNECRELVLMSVMFHFWSFSFIRAIWPLYNFLHLCRTYGGWGCNVWSTFPKAGRGSRQKLKTLISVYVIRLCECFPIEIQFCSLWSFTHFYTLLLDKACHVTNKGFSYMIVMW